MTWREQYKPQTTAVMFSFVNMQIWNENVTNTFRFWDASLRECTPMDKRVLSHFPY